MPARRRERPRGHPPGRRAGSSRTTPRRASSLRGGRPRRPRPPTPPPPRPQPDPVVNRPRGPHRRSTAPPGQAAASKVVVAAAPRGTPRQSRCTRSRRRCTRSRRRRSPRPRNAPRRPHPNATHRNAPRRHPTRSHGPLRARGHGRAHSAAHRNHARPLSRTARPSPPRAIERRHQRAAHPPRRTDRTQRELTQTARREKSAPSLTQTARRAHGRASDGLQGGVTADTPEMHNQKNLRGPMLGCWHGSHDVTHHSISVFNYQSFGRCVLTHISRQQFRNNIVPAPAVPADTVAYRT